MQKLRNFAKSVWNQKTAIIHSIVLVTLISTAIWDAEQIVRDYVKDNYFSLVKFSTVNDTFPFLEDAKMQVCMFYNNAAGEHTVFHELWINKSVRAESMPFFNISAAIRRFENDTDDPIDPRSLSLRDRAHVSSTLRWIQLMDDSIIRCVLGKQYNSCNVARFVRLNPALESPDFLEELEMATWAETGQYIFRRRYLSSAPVPSPPPYELYYFNTYEACVELRLSVVVPETNGRGMIEFHFGIISDRRDIHFYEDLPEPTIKFLLPNRADSNDVSTKNSRSYIVIGLENVGIHDRSMTTPGCAKSTESPIRLRTQLMPSYASVKYLKAVATTCGCIPYSYRRQYAPRESLAPYRNLTACTAQSYTFCAKRLQVDMASQGDRSPPPCKSVHNRYTIRAQKSTGGVHAIPYKFYDNSSTLLYSRRQVSLQCYDYVYIVYEERFQLTPQQLIAQVGGNIGLYTGISILGIWQVLAHTYTAYKERKASLRSRSGPTKTTIRRRVIDTFVAALRNSRDRRKQSMGQPGISEEFEALYQRIERIAEKDKQREERMARMEREIQEPCQLIKMFLKGDEDDMECTRRKSI